DADEPARARLGNAVSVRDLLPLTRAAADRAGHEAGSGFIWEVQEAGGDRGRARAGVLQGGGLPPAVSGEARPGKLPRQLRLKGPERRNGGRKAAVPVFKRER